MVKYTCPTCFKEFNKKDNFVKHTQYKKKPCKLIIPNIPNIPKYSQIIQNNTKNENIENTDKKYTCQKCNISFSTGFNLNKHVKYNCKVLKLEKLKNDETELLKKNFEEINECKIQLKFLRKELEKDKIFTNNTEMIKSDIDIIKKNLKKLEEIIPLKESKLINDKLINIIVDKEKKIDELINIAEDDKIVTFNNNNNIDTDNSNEINLIINNEIIMYRETDKYINATQLCKAGGKKFSHWVSLDSTKELIEQLEINLNSNAGIPALDNYNITNNKKISKPEFTENILIEEENIINKNIKISKEMLIDSKVGGDHSGTWIHPDLAIQLAQWISPYFALQVSSWIRTLFTNGKVEVNIELLKEKDKRIKILEDLTLKKQKRKDYPESNVIYLLTTEASKKKRIYILGKAEVLKDRLSSYNKTCEHDVVYYKGCKNKKHMDLVEKMVLNKLDDYREKENRDRFILPLEKNINFFKDIIDKCIDF